MASVYKVAEYILGKTGSIPAMKLQKLLYYSQVWSLAWSGFPLFTDRIEAWTNGPVVRSLYAVHRQEFLINPSRFLGYRGEPLTEKQKETVDRVLQFYGDKSSHWLSNLTHMEDPWKNARLEKGLTDAERSQVEITPAAIMKYYSAI